MIDVDNFKDHNDSLGHLTGDVLLREVALIIKNNIREIDLAARYGGEEFAVVLPYTSEENVMVAAERILKAINTHTFSGANRLAPGTLTVSIGIAFCPSDAHTMNDLIQVADQRLFEAKRRGKNQICISQEPNGKMG
jgi:two-component system cell cycle response regulator